MSLDDLDSPGGMVCVNHRRRETAVRCGKCERPICTKCMVQTPVGVRCRDCAQMRRLPQYEISPLLLARSALGGLAVSAIAWYLVSLVPFLRFFLSILVGAAVAEAMSRLAKRRDNRWLEIAAVVVVVAGLALAQLAVFAGSLSVYGPLFGQTPGYLISLAVPVIIAAVVAVVKLR